MDKSRPKVAMRSGRTNNNFVGIASTPQNGLFKGGCHANPYKLEGAASSIFCELSMSCCWSGPCSAVLGATS